jgi:site-specific recombinase XerD
VGRDIELTSVVPETLEQWAQDLRADGYASVPVRRKFAAARVFFTFWVRRRVIEKSPMWGIRLDLGRERVLPRNLNGADATKLIEKVWQGLEIPVGPVSRTSDSRFLRLRNVAALEILFATGMRVGELVALRVQDWWKRRSALL